MEERSSDREVSLMLERGFVSSHREPCPRLDGRRNEACDVLVFDVLHSADAFQAGISDVMVV